MSASPQLRLKETSSRTQSCKQNSMIQTLLQPFFYSDLQLENHLLSSKTMRQNYGQKSHATYYPLVICNSKNSIGNRTWQKLQRKKVTSMPKNMEEGPKVAKIQVIEFIKELSQLWFSFSFAIYLNLSSHFYIFCQSLFLQSLEFVMFKNFSTKVLIR